AVASALALADELGTFSAAEAVHALEAGSVDLGLVKPLDGGQGAAPSFAADHTLHQALYVLEIDPHAQWSNRVSEQLALARQVAVLDEEGSVDTVDGQRSSPC